MARIYPPELVKAIVKGIKRQTQEDGEYRETHSLEAGPSPDEDTRLEDYEEEFLPTSPEKKVGKTGEEDQIFYDDVTGVQLSTEGVLKAREEELAWVHKAKIYEKRPLDECWSVTGKTPITLKWIDRNKGDREHPNYRSRVVARGIKKQHGALPGHMLFSNMPPLEAAKLLCSDLATRKKSRSGKALQLALCDISRAHFYGVAKRQIYVTLPPNSKRCSCLAR